MTGMPPPVASAERFLGVRFTRPAAVSSATSSALASTAVGAAAGAGAGISSAVVAGSSISGAGAASTGAEPKAPGTLSSSDSGRLGGGRTRRPFDRTGGELVADERLQASLEVVPVGDGIEEGARLFGQVLEVGQLGQPVVDVVDRGAGLDGVDLLDDLDVVDRIEGCDLGLELGLGEGLLELVELEVATGRTIGGDGGVGLGVDHHDVVDRGRRSRGVLDRRGDHRLAVDRDEHRPAGSPVR